MTPDQPDVVHLRPQAAGSSLPIGREGLLWVFAAGLLLFIGILKGINLVIVLGYVMVGLMAVNVLLARWATRGLSARRLPRPPVQAGTAAEWVIEVRDEGTASGTWMLEERVGEVVAAWLVVRAGKPAVLRPRVRGTFPRRGIFRLEPLVARSGFPFGLVRSRVRLTAAEELVVLPRPARVDPERLRAWLLRAWAGSDQARRRVRRVVEREGEIFGLRDYRAGDSPRRVHWKATARRNRLVVREYEDSAPPRLLLLVDAWLPDGASDADRDRLEAVISVAAGVVREWRREAGARLTLALAGRNPVVIDGPPGPGFTERQLVPLALAEGGEAGGLAGLFDQVPRASWAAPVLVLSSRPDSPMTAAAGGFVGRPVAFAWTGQPAGWFQPPYDPAG